MVSEIHLAFAHPSERAEATATAPLDRISLRDHVVEGEIGAFQVERGVTQRILFNVVVEVAPLHRPVDDDVDRILSYDRVTEAIATELAASRVNLLETLAENIATRILQEPQALRVFIRIEKLDRGPGALGVEIVRSAGQGRSRAEGTSLAPRVVLLSPAAAHSPHLNDWLDELTAAPQPVVLCVAAGDHDIPRTGDPSAQRRIDLLEIGQAAWALAGRAPRCLVVDTLTELDWGMKNGQLSVWAPSKTILDASDADDLDVTDPAAMTEWLADQLTALEWIAVGLDLPSADRSLPLETERLL